MSSGEKKETPTPTSPALDAAWPPDLRRAETEAVRQRRDRAGVARDGPLVGMALSGGGIRSATFCLGVFQALARLGLVRRIDVLSTVSGGGYFGSCLGGLFLRSEPAGPDTVEATLADGASWPVRWLRENGRYMSPNGAGDLLLAAAVLLRNWIALQVVLVTFLTLVLAALTLLRSALGEWLPLLHLVSEAPPAAGPWWSPWLVLPMLTGVPLLLLGGIYWLTQIGGLVGSVQWLLGRFSGMVRGAGRAAFLNRARNLLSRWLALWLMLTLVLGALALLDSVGQTVYARWSAADFRISWVWTGSAAAWVAAFGVAQKLFLVLDKLPRRGGFRIPFQYLALIAAVLWVAAVTVVVSVLVHRVAWAGAVPTGGGMPGLRTLGILAGASFGLSWWFSRSFGFVNLSSQQQLYAARLKRAYLGASNPVRRERRLFSVTDPIPGDDIPFHDYDPQRHGGPLHLVNITVNETVSGKSQIEQRDRKGLPLAVGPCGLSFGIVDHALWRPGRQAVRPVLAGDGRRFHALHGDRMRGGAEPGHPVESLDLGNWVAISGAAFTTGLGAGTSMGLSLLLGLTNVRLGYWWDSGVPPTARSSRTRPRLIGRLGELLGWLLPVQMCLLDEFLARFHGPARRHWYLSDGGHFENTACYELVRRRLPFIVCTDGGRDPAYEFADLANLVRKARTDFGAEIEVVRRRPDAAAGTAAAGPWLEDLLHPDVVDLFGTQEEFEAVPAVAVAEPGRPAARPRHGRRHALLARVHYADTGQQSFILFLKPSLTGDEPADLLQYQIAQPNFPQESTMDQYFDEAQWESYRKLGEHIASRVFAPVSASASGWSPGSMTPPAAGSAAPRP